MKINPAHYRTPWTHTITLRDVEMPLLAPEMAELAEGTLATKEDYAAAVRGLIPEHARGIVEHLSYAELMEVQAIYSGLLTQRMQVASQAAAMVAAHELTPKPAPVASGAKLVERPADPTTSELDELLAQIPAGGSGASKRPMIKLTPGGGPLPAAMGGELWGAARAKAAQRTVEGASA